MPRAFLPLLSLLSVAAALAAPPTVYVSTKGNDAWSGRLAAPNAAGTDGPFASLQRARDEVRKLRADGAGVCVQVRGGRHVLPRALPLDTGDSGTEAGPIVWEAYPGEKPIISGARVVSGFSPYRGKVLQADASDLKGTYFRQLFLDGRRQVLARTPNFDPKNPYGGGWSYVDGKLVSMYSDLPGDDKRKVVYKEGDVPELARPEEAEVFIFPRYNWWNNNVRVQSLDRATRTITLAADCSYAPRPGDRYYVRNGLELLDSPGEWYLDKQSWTLYFWPPAKLGPQSVTVSSLDNLVQVKDASWITFRGLTFEGSERTAIGFANCKHCTLAASTVRNTVGVWDWGLSAVTVTGGEHNRIVGNDIHDTGGHAISLSGGDRKTLTPADNVADNNYLHHVGQMYKQGVGVALNGVGNRASHNLIHDGPRMGIIFSGNNLVIEYNEIRHVNLETEDTGAVYTGGRDWISSRGSVIRYNYFHDILGYGHDQYGRWLSPHFAWGVYLDDNTGGVDVIGNLLVRCPSALVHLHNGRDNLIENNILIGGRDQQVQYSGWTDKHSYWVKFQQQMRDGYNMVKDQPAWQGMRYLDIGPEQAVLPDHTIMAHDVFRRNIIWYDSAKAPLYRLRSVNLDYNTFEQNVIHNAGGPVTVGLPGVEPKDQWAEWQKLGQDRGSLLADPLFVDAAHGDYRLKPDSPALKLGFQQLPLRRLGLYKSPDRATWPVVEAEGAREHPLISQDSLPIPAAAAAPRFPAPVPVPAVGAPAAQLKLAETPGRTPVALPAVASLRWRGGSGPEAGTLYVSLTVPLAPGTSPSLGQAWGQHDGAEVCLQALSGEKPAGPIYVLHGFANGSAESMTDGGATVAQARTLGTKVRYAAQAGAGQWTAEWAIPLAALGASPAPAARLRCNLGLYRASSGEWSCWAGTEAQNWVVANAGLIVLQ